MTRQLRTVFAAEIARKSNAANYASTIFPP